MKVLMINSVCGIGSTGRICTDIAQCLTADGHDCKIAYGRKGTVPESALPYAKRIGNDLDVRVHGIMTRIFDAHGFGSRRATIQFVNWMKEYDPDIIHLHNLHGYYLHIGVLFNALKEMHKPVVWTLHDCWAFTGHCAYFDKITCDKWKNCCYNCPQKHDYPSSLVMGRSYNNFRNKKLIFSGVDNLTLIAPSEWLANLTRHSFLRQYPVQVFPNGINLDVFRPTESDFGKQYQLEEKHIVLGVAGIWEKRKGLPDMIRLANLLGDAYAVVIVGVSEEQKNNLPKSVIGITRTENLQALAEIYTAAYVVVNPTYEDNYPTVNLEAQACGTPVITYRTGGSVESVHADCIVEQGDVAGLATKIMAHTAKCKEGLLLDKNETAQRYIELYFRIARQTTKEN